MAYQSTDDSPLIPLLGLFYPGEPKEKLVKSHINDAGWMNGLPWNEKEDKNTSSFLLAPSFLGSS